MDTRSANKGFLFELLILKKRFPQHVNFRAFDELIVKIELALEEEDVALVEKRIAELDKE